MMNPAGAGVVLVLTTLLTNQFVGITPAQAQSAAQRSSALSATPVSAAPDAPEGGFGLGRGALADEIAAWDIDVRPDGLGLPAGRGDVMTGEEIFSEKCASCHGDFGEAVGRWPVLAGGFDTLTSERPVKTIGSYWPYLSTVFDYVNRAMPFGDARSLTNDEVYAITAYLLFLNDQVEEDFELSQGNFSSVQLPNQVNFFPDDRPETELPAFSATPCMNNCKETVEITMRARILDVTPQTDESDRATKASIEGTGAEAAETPARDLDLALVAEGEKGFRKCKACHQVGDTAKNRTGPQLNGLFGRVAGAAEGFKYSNAFKTKNEEGLTWNDETLAEFLKKPKAYIEGTNMAFRGFSDPEDIAAILAYLRTYSQ